MAKKKIVVLTTGGTIAGVGESGKDTGYTSGALSGEALVASVPELADYAEVSVEEVCNINSDDMTDRIWIQLSRRVAELQEDESVDGVVITHGTDTMDETAYFLSLTVKCEKAVILTGSMKPATSFSARCVRRRVLPSTTILPKTRCGSISEGNFSMPVACRSAARAP